MNEFPIEKVIKGLKKHKELQEAPVLTYIANLTKDPYRILISCILSLRTKDRTTSAAASRLFNVADTPDKMIKLTKEQIANLIYPVGFYNVKAEKILKITGILLNEYKGEVPSDLDELLKLPGVGRKTANLVITEAYGKDGICVDTHVHRITNRWGFVSTRSPYETEVELKKRLPKRYWKELNSLLVKFGQTVCVPVAPFCSKCKIINYCKRNNVKRNR